MISTIFLTFAKIGLFTFGGGLAMIPIIESICVEKKKWITHDEMMDVTVIAEATPGPIAINCATFVGYRKKGISGAIAATLGVVLPSFVILLLISLFLNRFLEIVWVANAFKGIRIAVGLMILDAGIQMIRKMKRERLPLVILGVSFTAMLLIDLFAWNFSSILLMLIAGGVSLAVYSVGGTRARKAGDGT